MTSRRIRQSLAIALGAAAVILRLVALDHGFPDVNEEATPVKQAWEMWDWQTGSIDPNPRFFNYPALTFYIHWAVQAAYRLATESTGLRDWGPSEELPLDLVLIGRLINTLFTIGIALYTYRLGKRLVPKSWAIWASLTVLWMPTLFHYSILSIVDVPLAFFAAVFLDRLHDDTIDRSTLREHVHLGLLVGLAASCKYTGLFLAIPYVVRQLADNEWKPDALLRLNPWCAGITSVVTFLAINPFIILDYETFYWNYSFERHHMAVGHFGRVNSPFSEYGWTVWRNLGPIALLLAAAGTVDLIRSRRAKWLPAGVFTVLYPGFLVIWATSFGHYLFPVFPVIVLVAIHGLRVCGVTLRRTISPKLGALAIPILALAPIAVWSAQEFTHMRSPTPRALAREWLTGIEPGAIIATEPGGPQISSAQRQVLLPMHTTNPEQANPVYDLRWYRPMDYFLVVESVEARYRIHAEQFPDQMGLYDQLASEWELAVRFGREGEGIRIYMNPLDSRSDIATYPKDLYAKLDDMSRVLAGRFLERIGKAYRGNRRMEFAAQIYSKLSNVLPDQDYALAYAEILLALGLKEEAIRVLESRRENGDDHLMASLHFLKGENDSAVAAWSRAVDQSPGNTQILMNLARLHLMMGKPQEAADYYERAIDAGVNEVEAYVRACALLIRSGHTRRARDIAVRGLARWPDNEHLQKWGK